MKKKIKAFLKIIFPLRVRKLLRRIQTKVRRAVGVMSYIYYTEKMNRNSSKKSVIEVAVFIMYAEAWNSFESIYRSIKLRKDMNITVYVFAGNVYMNDGNDKYHLKLKIYDEMINFFRVRGIDIIKAYRPETDSWISSMDIKADYIFYDRPYDAVYLEEFSVRQMHKRAKVCYIPYGFMLTKSITMMNVIVPPDFFRYCYLFFASWNFPADYVRDNIYNRFECKFHHIIREGYPRFDLTAKNNSSDKQFTVLWNPRFAIRGLSHDDPTSATSFFDFWQKIIPRAYRTKNEYWIIRPHPIALSEYVNKKIITSSELEQYISKLNQNPNTELDRDKDYMKAFARSSVMLADFSSIIIEYMASGKPVIYCGNPEAIPIDEMLECMYHASSWDEAVRCLDDLKNGHNPLALKRYKFAEKLSNDGKIGERIVQVLIEDYRKKGQIKQ